MIGYELFFDSAHARIVLDLDKCGIYIASPGQNGDDFAFVLFSERTSKYHYGLPT